MVTITFKNGNALSCCDALCARMTVEACASLQSPTDGDRVRDIADAPNATGSCHVCDWPLAVARPSVA